VGDIPLSTQTKLLRVLQERSFYPVGSDKLMGVDVRVIVATQKKLEDQVKQGLFREDLFYRIHVIPILLPPLRERKEDIPPLVEHFLKKFNQLMGKKVKGLTPPAMQRLMLHNWPGNVRELENTVEYGVALTQQDVITEDLILQTQGDISQQPLTPLKEAKDAFERNYLVRLLELCEGNVSKAAALAGKYRADFYDLLKKHNISKTSYKKLEPEA
jgi:two-component system response regulator GlrR